MAKKPSSLYMYFSALSMNLISFAAGVAYSWTSPLIPKFISKDPAVNPIGRRLTPSETGLLVSIINLGLLFGPFVSGILAGKLNKKWSIVLVGLPLFFSHILCAWADTFTLFIVARLMMGLATGGVWSVLPGYLSEIAEPRNRGLVNSLMLVGSCVGSLYTYLVGPFVSVRVFSFLNLIPTGAYTLLVVFFVPSSPYDLVIKHRTEEAKRSLVMLRRTENVDKELMEIEKIVETSSREHAGLRELFRNEIAVAALKLCFPLMVFNAFSGMYIVLGYTQTIFKMAGSTLKPEYSAILVGVVAVVGSSANMYFVDRLGRKPILVMSCLFSSLSHFILGTFFHLQHRGLVDESLGWIPVASVISFTVSFYFGLSSLPWIVLGELFKANTKAVASTICAGLNFTLAFLMTLAYPYSLDWIGIGNTYYVFSANLAGCLIFTLFKLPETKGKTFEEIYALLNKRIDKS